MDKKMTANTEMAQKIPFIFKSLVILMTYVTLISVITSGCATRSLVTRRPDDLKNFRVIESTDTKIWISIDYSHFSQQDSGPVLVGAYALKNDDESRWFGYGPMKIKRGKGNAVVSLTFMPRDGPPEISTEKIKMTMYIGGKRSFYSEIFEYPKKWNKISKKIETENTKRPLLAIQLDDFENFRVIDSTDSEIRVAIDYCHFSKQARGHVSVGAYVLRNNNDEEVRGFGLFPIEIKQASGTATIRLIFSSKNGPQEISTDKIQMIMYISSKARRQWLRTFYRENFDYPKKWKR